MVVVGILNLLAYLVLVVWKSTRFDDAKASTTTISVVVQIKKNGAARNAHFTISR